MPGSFAVDSPDSPPHSLPPPQDTRKKGQGLFSNWSKRLGFDRENDEGHKQLQNLIDQPKVPAPQTGSEGGAPGPSQPPKDDGRVTSPAVVQQNLLNAINSTRAHDSRTLFSPPQTNEVKEQASYCDSTAAHDLRFVADAPQGMRVFVANDLSMDQGKFLEAHSRSITTFEGVLRDIGTIYGLAPTVLHIFYDERGNTIAFNSNGSVFCNLRFFLQLHAERMGSGNGRTEATTWWWVVIAHELAHNLVQPHNSDHSYYTESFIQQFFPKMMAKAAQWNTSAPAAAAAAAAPSTANAGGNGQHSLPPPPAYSQQAPARNSLIDL